MHVGKDIQKAPSISLKGGGNPEDYVEEKIFREFQLPVPSPLERACPDLSGGWGEAVAFKNSPLPLPSNSNHTLRNYASADTWY
jgi:hypothetical protein